MRTTLDLEQRLMHRIRRKAIEEHKSLKEVINQALNRGLDEDSARNLKQPNHKLPVFSMGTPKFNLDKALAMADLMEDDSVNSKFEMRK
jgi:hypothetical protein